MAQGYIVNAGPLRRGGGGGEPFEENMGRLAGQWRKQQVEAGRRHEAIARNPKEQGYDS
jgi:hypothetical protein